MLGTHPSALSWQQLHDLSAKLGASTGDTHGPTDIVAIRWVSTIAIFVFFAGFLACFSHLFVTDRDIKRECKFQEEMRSWDGKPNAKRARALGGLINAVTWEKVNVLLQTWQKAGAAFTPSVP